jgi:hypothetical protein
VSEPASQAIEIRFHDLNELFDNLDPAPIHERDLDLDAEEYIVSYARELRAEDRLRMVLHLPRAQAERDCQAIAASAVRRFFTYKAEMSRREFREFLRRARVTLLIAFAFFSACHALGSAVAWAAGQWAMKEPFGVLKLGLEIISWVAMWKPLELLLYDWWPLRSQLLLHRRLAAMDVAVRYSDP